jgi:hypothetical protein
VPSGSTTVRFGDDLWDLLQREAAREGLSAAQYVRDAAVLRLAFAMAAQGDDQAQATLADVAARSVGRRPDSGAAGGNGLHPTLTDAERRAALGRTGLMEGTVDESFDRLTNAVARVLQAPVALVSLVDADRQVFAGCVGLPEPWASDRQTALSHSFCQHAVTSRERLVVSDARNDPRVKDNLAIEDLGVVAYAGYPLIDRAGNALGSLCVIDHEPRTWKADELDLLSDLAETVVAEIEARATRRTA